MKKDKSIDSGVSRRRFMKVISASSAGLMVSPALLSGVVAAAPKATTTVATASISTYDEKELKQAVEESFKNIGGLSDIINPGDSVGIKINLTGGSVHAKNYQDDTGLHPADTYWTHPTLIKVVGQAFKDAGAGKIYLLEALYDWESVHDFGYDEVIEALDADFIDINEKAPFTDYIQKNVGTDNYFYENLTLNGIFDQIDCFVTMPKAKQHASAGITHGLKNSIGILPIPSGLYNDGKDHRAGIHNHTRYDNNKRNNLCRVILDINRAVPIKLVVNDAIKTVLGSEGPWTGPGITPATFNKLIIGKDPVAVDSVSTSVMGFDPMAADYESPFPQSINYLKLASEKGMGEYDLNNIEVVDHLVGVEEGAGINVPNAFILNQNYPNPFNPTTTISYSIPELSNVVVGVFNSLGQKVKDLVNQDQVAGSYQVTFDAKDLTSGIYFCTMKSKNFFRTIKMTLLK